MGFQSHMIEVLNSPENLRGYTGDIRQQKCDVRIKGHGWKNQNYVGGLSNDLGWELQKDGTYALHVSEYDMGKYNAGWQQKLLQQYSCEVIKEVATQHNFFIDSETTENGEIYISVSTPF